MRSSRFLALTLTFAVAVSTTAIGAVIADRDSLSDRTFLSVFSTDKPISAATLGWYDGEDTATYHAIEFSPGIGTLTLSEAPEIGIADPIRQIFSLTALLSDGQTLANSLLPGPPPTETGEVSGLARNGDPGFLTDDASPLGGLNDNQAPDESKIVQSEAPVWGLGTLYQFSLPIPETTMMGLLFALVYGLRRVFTRNK